MKITRKMFETLAVKASKKAEREKIECGYTVMLGKMKAECTVGQDNYYTEVSVDAWPPGERPVNIESITIIGEGLRYDWYPTVPFQVRVTKWEKIPGQTCPGWKTTKIKWLK